MKASEFYTAKKKCTMKCPVQVCDESNEAIREEVAGYMSSTGTVLHRWVI